MKNSIRTLFVVMATAGIAYSHAAHALNTIEVGKTYTDPMTINQFSTFDFGNTLKDPDCVRDFMISKNRRQSEGAKIIQLQVRQALYKSVITQGSPDTLFSDHFRIPRIRFHFTYKTLSNNAESWTDYVDCVLER